MAAYPYPPPAVPAPASPPARPTTWGFGTIAMLGLVGLVGWRLLESRREERAGETRVGELDEALRHCEEGEGWT